MSESAFLAAYVPAHLECPFCFDSLREPLQLLDCGHIFCARCIEVNGVQCYVCHTVIRRTGPPRDSILQAALAVPVLCSQCGWRGTRAESISHVCDPTQIHPSSSRYAQRADTEWVRAAMKDVIRDRRTASADAGDREGGDVMETPDCAEDDAVTISEAMMTRITMLTRIDAGEGRRRYDARDFRQ